MVGALKPGGWLICEEFDSLSMPADPAHHPDERALKAQAAMQRVMASRGANTRYGRSLGRGCIAPTSSNCEKNCCGSACSRRPSSTATSPA
jgi:hypothetical protein